MSQFLWRFLVIGTLVSGLSACAVVPPNTGENPSDPWETMNRQTYAFNMKVDELILHPLAVNYREYVPTPVQSSVRNFFHNLGEPGNSINNLLQGKVEAGCVSLARFLINSTVGIVGFFDVASHMNLTHSPEDFGETLGVWGVSQGPYIVWPLLGFSTVRDSIGLAFTTASNPMTYMFMGDTDYPWVPWTASAIYPVTVRADLLASDAVIQTALDPYVAVRDAYLQHRLSLVWDGNPPLELPVDEFEDEQL